MAVTEEESWWSSFVNGLKDIGGTYLNYDLTKEQIKNGSSSSSTTAQQPTYTTPTSSNNTMLIIGGIAVVAVLFMVMKK